MCSMPLIIYICLKKKHFDFHEWTMREISVLLFPRLISFNSFFLMNVCQKIYSDVNKISILCCPLFIFVGLLLKKRSILHIQKLYTRGYDIDNCF